MALAILLDAFPGDPQELYELVVEEVHKREIPGVQITGATERRSKGWFAAGEVVPSLTIADSEHKVMLLAYQFGRSFHVSTRAYWQKVKMAERERDGKLVFLEEVRSGCFSETVNRAVRAALVRHMGKRSAPVPSELDPKDIFYRREDQRGESGE